MARLVLAATLSPSYGIYGPPFEHCWSDAREQGSEEYLNSEKYQVHHFDLNRPDSLNALSKHMLSGMHDLFTRLDRRSSTRAIILFGTG